MAGATKHTPLSEDAALVATLAGTAMTFSPSAEDQAERWLRALRLHGQVGSCMQALGIGESPLDSGADMPPLTGAAPDLGDDPAHRVVDRAEELASDRRAEQVCTQDMLFALFDLYGELMERAIYVRGSSRHELEERLAGSG